MSYNQPFAEQVDFFRRKLNLPTEYWDDIERMAHDRAFIVAGAQDADLLADLRRAIDKAIAQGTGLDEFRRDFKQIAFNRGWTGWTGEGSKGGEAWRTKVIYQTNMATSYAAGRWKQLNDPEMLKILPYWQYHHNDSVMHPRPLHLSWDGLTLPHDHPFWKTHFAPNGWGCMCWISAVSKSAYMKAIANGKGKPPAGWDTIDPKTGAPIGIDKGFDYAPGANANRPLKDFIDQKLIKLDAPIGAAMWETLKPILLTDRAAAVRAMVVKTIQLDQFNGASEIAHVVAPKTIEDLSARGVVLMDAAVWLRDEELIHALRDKKAAPLPDSIWLDITNHLNHAIPYWDTVDKRLIYVFDITEKLGKVAVRVNFTQKVRVDGKRVNTGSNFIRTGGIMPLPELNAKTKNGNKRYERLNK